MPDNADAHEKTDPGVVSDRILETVLGLVKDQMEEQSSSQKRLMVLMLVMMVVNAGLSGINLAVQTMGLNISTHGDATVKVSEDRPPEISITPTSSEPEPSPVLPEAEGDAPSATPAE